LKQFASKVLPKTFDFKRKQGFSVPLGSWMKKSSWRDMLHDTLLSDNCLFEKDYVNKLIKGLDSGRNNGERLFSLLLLELWRIEYGVQRLNIYHCLAKFLNHQDLYIGSVLTSKLQ